MQKNVIQPEWTSNPSVLQHRLFTILSKIYKDQINDYTNQFFDEVALKNYWIKAFTHKSIDAQNNYEELELYGDKVLNYAFLMYLRDRFKGELDQAKGTLLLNQYMSKKFQAQLSRELGLPELIRYDPEIPRINISIQEDIFESFCAVIALLAEDRIAKGLGYIFIYNLVAELYEKVPINLSEIQKDDITLLKEIYEKMGWGAPSYVTKNSDNPSLGPYRTEIRGKTGEVLGFGYGSESDAPFKAAAAAIKTLEGQGITWESADRMKMERSKARDPEFNLQYERVQKAIKMLSEQAKAQGKLLNEEFKVQKISEQKVGHTTRYTFAIQISYPSGTGGVTWRNLEQLTGDNAEQTKISLMKSFADKYGA